MSASYCSQRLKTYGKRCGVKARPHQLRHSCATLLLNSSTPVQTVKTILGHKFVDTTMRYARLYDGKVVADYYLAMSKTESSMTENEENGMNNYDMSDILELVDSLSTSSLNANQVEILSSLRNRFQAILISSSQQR